MHIDANTVDFIMGALATCYSEGTIHCVDMKSPEEYDSIINCLVKQLHANYPDIVMNYDWLPSVKNIKKSQGK